MDSNDSGIPNQENHDESNNNPSTHLNPTVDFYDTEVFDSGNYSEHVTPDSLAFSSPLHFMTPIMSPGSTRGSRSCSQSDQESVKSTLEQYRQQGTIASTPYLQGLLDNFNSLYEQKLQDAEVTRPNSDDPQHTLEVKNSIMSDWVRDLNEQNRVLIETVDEMEKEAEDKIHLLQSKVQRSAQMLMDHMTVIQEYEKQVQTFIIHRDETESHLQIFYAEADDLLRKKNSLDEKLSAVEAEHASLLKLISRIRDWGVWDITGLELGTRTYKQLFDLYPGLPGSEVQTVFTQERGRQVRDNETKLQELEFVYKNLHEQYDATNKLNQGQTSLIADLQNERTELKVKIAALEAESNDYHRKLEESHELFTKTFLLNTQSSNDTTRGQLDDLARDLRHIKDELHLTQTDGRTVKSEASALKSEMNHRLEEVTQIKLMLQDLQEDSESTKEKVRALLDRQQKLGSVQEKLETLSSNNSEKVQNLQDKVGLLLDKITKFEKLEVPSSIPLTTSLLDAAQPTPTICPPKAPTCNPQRVEGARSAKDSATTKTATSKNPAPEKPLWNSNFYSKKNTVEKTNHVPSPIVKGKGQEKSQMPQLSTKVQEPATKLSQMEIGIGQWVMDRSTTAEDHLSSETIEKSVESSSNNNMDLEGRTNYLVSLRDLKAKLKLCEEESGRKNLLMKKLETELKEEKESRQKVETKMDSKDAEITMQKPEDDLALRRFPLDYGSPTTPRRSGSGDAEQVMSETEKLVAAMKTDSANLFARTELLEKNILIYQSHQTFKQLEDDYFSMIDTANPYSDKSKGTRLGCTDMFIQDPNVVDIAGWTLRDQMDAVKLDNIMLKRRLDDVEGHLNVLQRESAQTVPPPLTLDPDLTNVATYINSLFIQLESEKEIISQEKLRLETLFREEDPLRTDLKRRPNFMKLAVAELFQLQGEQLQHYDSYVNRLHSEIRSWLPTASGECDLNCNSSVITLLRRKVQSDSEILSNSLDDISVADLKIRCRNAEATEMQLRSENSVLRGIIEDLNKLYARGRRK